MEFNVGDKVRIVKDIYRDYGWLLGETGTIDFVSCKRNGVRCYNFKADLDLTIIRVYGPDLEGVIS